MSCRLTMPGQGHGGLGGQLEGLPERIHHAAVRSRIRGETTAGEGQRDERGDIGQRIGDLDRQARCLAAGNRDPRPTRTERSRPGHRRGGPVRASPPRPRSSLDPRSCSRRTGRRCREPVGRRPARTANPRRSTAAYLYRVGLTPSVSAESGPLADAPQAQPERGPKQEHPETRDGQQCQVAGDRSG